MIEPERGDGSPSRLSGRTRLARLLGLWLLAAVGFACAREVAPPNLVLISLDTTRRDHLSAYGYHRGTTPHLERLAAEGARFELAYAPSSTTAPSHATLFTSLHPITHRVTRNGRALAPAHRTLAQHVKEAGYSTAGFVSSYVLAGRFGLAQGFDHWDDAFEPSTATVPPGAWTAPGAAAVDRRGDATMQRALDWLRHERPVERPFFLFVHQMDPHLPYVPPPAFADRFRSSSGPRRKLQELIASYDAEIAFADAQIGELLSALDQLGLAEDTLVVVTADHGEGLMNHDMLGHGAHLYEEQVRVPLVLRWPGRIPAGRLVGGPVSLLDVAPTLLDLAGLPPPADMQGLSLAGAITGAESLDPERPIFLYRREYEPGHVEGQPVAGEKFGVRVGDFKLVIGPEEGTRELFDVRLDPLERRNLAEVQPERAAELEKHVTAWRAEFEREGAAPDAVSEAELERLRALGYVR